MRDYEIGAGFGTPTEFWECGTLEEVNDICYLLVEDAYKTWDKERQCGNGHIPDDYVILAYDVVSGEELFSYVVGLDEYNIIAHAAQEGQIITPQKAKEMTDIFWGKKADGWGRIDNVMHDDDILEVFQLYGGE